MNKLPNLISHDIPEIYYECKKHFGVNWSDVIITYYPHIYAEKDINDFKLVHELQHISQQEKYGVKEWWARYFQDKDFRLSQELEAYRQESAFIMDKVKDREYRFKLLTQIAKDLSSSVYGEMIDFERARKLLK